MAKFIHFHTAKQVNKKMAADSAAIFQGRGAERSLAHSFLSAY